MEPLMSMRINIENILKSSEDIFQEIVNKLLDNNMKLAKQELKASPHQFDTILFNAIELTLKKLRYEEGFFSRFFYKLFGVGIKKNKRREQLLILGSQLKNQYSKVKLNREQIQHHSENLSSSLRNLKRLQEAFKDKNRFLSSPLLERSQSYINQIEDKLETIKVSQSELNNKLRLLQEIINEYKALFKKIPRYHELQEETYLQLSAPA